MKDIVLAGSGGLAKEIKWLIDECNKVEPRWNILGWISKEPKGTLVAGLPVLGDDDWVINYEKPIDVAICVGNGRIRKIIAEKYRKNINVSFPNIIAPDATISDSVHLGVGCIIAAKSVFTVDINVGNFMICNYSCTVGHDCSFGDYVTLLPASHISGTVSLGECSSVGVGANIIQGISIGENTFIGAGATVVRNIPSNCTAVGVPARPLEK